MSPADAEAFSSSRQRQGAVVSPRRLAGDTGESAPRIRVIFASQPFGVLMNMAGHAERIFHARL